MKTCECQKEKNIAYYEYIKIDKLMGFEDHDRYDLIPNFCPHCGQDLRDEIDMVVKKKCCDNMDLVFNMNKTKAVCLFCGHKFKKEDFN